MLHSLFNYLKRLAIKSWEASHSFFHSKRCPKCYSKRMEYSGSWIGGWNNLCDQATSREGYRCFDCGYKEWSQTDEEYKASLLDWCTPNC